MKAEEEDDTSPGSASAELVSSAHKQQKGQSK